MCDRDPGFLEGRQYSRAKSSKQRAVVKCETEPDGSESMADKPEGSASIADSFDDELDCMSSASTPPSSQPQTPASGPSTNPVQFPQNYRDCYLSSDRPHMCGILRGRRFCRCGVVRAHVDPPSGKLRATCAPGCHIPFDVEPAPGMTASPASLFAVQVPQVELLRAKEPWRFSAFDPPPTNSHSDSQQSDAAQRPRAACSTSVKKWKDAKCRAEQEARDAPFDPQPSSSAWLQVFALPLTSHALIFKSNILTLLPLPVQAMLACKLSKQTDSTAKINPGAGEFTPTLAYPKTVFSSRSQSGLSSYAEDVSSRSASGLAHEIEFSRRAGIKPKGIEFSVRSPPPVSTLSTSDFKTPILFHAASTLNAAAREFTPEFPLPSGTPAPTPVAARGAWGNGKPVSADAASVQRLGATLCAPPCQSEITASATPATMPAQGAWANGKPVSADAASVERQGATLCAPPSQPKITASAAPATMPAQGAWADGKPVSADAASLKRQGATLCAPPSQPKITASAAPATVPSQEALTKGKPACVALVSARIQATPLATSRDAEPQEGASAKTLVSTQCRDISAVPTVGYPTSPPEVVLKTTEGERSMKGDAREDLVTHTVMATTLTPGESTAAAAIANFKDAQAQEHEARQKKLEQAAIAQQKREAQEEAAAAQRKREEETKAERRSRYEKAKAEARQKREEEALQCKARAAAASANKRPQEMTPPGCASGANYYALLIDSACEASLADEDQEGGKVQPGGGDEGLLMQVANQFTLLEAASSKVQRCANPHHAEPSVDKSLPSPKTVEVEQGMVKGGTIGRRQRDQPADTDALREKEQWRFSKFEPPSFILAQEAEDEKEGALVHAARADSARLKWQLRRLCACAHARDFEIDQVRSAQQDVAPESLSSADVYHTNSKALLREATCSTAVEEEGEDSVSRLWRVCGGQGPLLPEGWNMCACLVPVKVGWGSCPRCFAPSSPTRRSNTPAL